MIKTRLFFILIFLGSFGRAHASVSATFLGTMLTDDFAQGTTATSVSVTRNWVMPVLSLVRYLVPDGSKAAL